MRRLLRSSQSFCVGLSALCVCVDFCSQGFTLGCVVSGFQPVRNAKLHFLQVLHGDNRLPKRIYKKKRIWSIRNLIAGISLIPFIYIITRTGWGEHLFIFSIPFGILSMILSFFNAKNKFTLDTTIAPFPSFTSLRLIRIMVPKFKKIKYPKELSKRRIRNTIWGNIMFIPSSVMWLVLGPVGLFFQMFPDREIEIKIKISS